MCVGGEDLYDDLMSTGICTLILDKTFVWAPRIIRKVSTRWFELANHLVQIVRVSYPRGSGLVGKSKLLRPVYLNLHHMERKCNAGRTHPAIDPEMACENEKWSWWKWHTWHTLESGNRVQYKATWKFSEQSTSLNYHWLERCCRECGNAEWMCPKLSTF